MEEEQSPTEQILIDRPFAFSFSIRQQLHDLIQEGGQILSNHIKVGLHRAELAGVVIKDEKVVASCCLKNPLTSYRSSVFDSAGVTDLKERFTYELGYIVTHSDYEGQKLCQKLLSEVFPIIKDKAMFASTRKPAMAHILTKFKFNPVGKVYKNDLTLFVYEP
jgi:predicted GNAT family N-acyltransferase